MTYNVTDLATACIQHGVDFEVFHSINPSNKQLRTAMLVSAGAAEVRIDFGDPKHGKLVSRVYLAGDHKVRVDIADVLAAIEANSAASSHSASQAYSSTTGHLPYDSVSNDGQLVFFGEVKEILDQDEDDTDSTVFILEVVQTVMVTSTEEILQTNPVDVIVRAYSADETTPNLTVGSKVRVEGRYLPHFGVETKKAVVAA